MNFDSELPLNTQFAEKGFIIRYEILGYRGPKY